MIRPGFAVCRVSFKQVGGALDLDLADPDFAAGIPARPRALTAEALADELADFVILQHPFLVGSLSGIPAAVPVSNDPETKPDRVYLLSHETLL